MNKDVLFLKDCAKTIANVERSLSPTKKSILKRLQELRSKTIEEYYKKILKE